MCKECLDSQVLLEPARLYWYWLSVIGIGCQGCFHCQSSTRNGVIGGHAAVMGPNRTLLMVMYDLSVSAWLKKLPWKIRLTWPGRDGHNTWIVWAWLVPLNIYWYLCPQLLLKSVSCCWLLLMEEEYVCMQHWFLLMILDWLRWIDSKIPGGKHTFVSFRRSLKTLQ